MSSARMMDKARWITTRGEVERIREAARILEDVRLELQDMHLIPDDGPELPSPLFGTDAPLAV